MSKKYIDQTGIKLKLAMSQRKQLGVNPQAFTKIKPSTNFLRILVHKEHFNQSKLELLVLFMLVPSLAIEA